MSITAVDGFRRFQEPGLGFKVLFLFTYAQKTMQSQNNLIIQL